MYGINYVYFSTSAVSGFLFISVWFCSYSLWYAGVCMKRVNLYNIGKADVKELVVNNDNNIYDIHIIIMLVHLTKIVACERMRLLYPYQRDRI